MHTGFLLAFDICNDGFNLRKIKALFNERVSSLECLQAAIAYRDFAIALHDADLDILCSSLHDLEQALHSQLDGILSRHVVFVILLKELANGLRGATYRVGLQYR